MARRIISVTTITPTASADTTNLTDCTYPFLIQGGTATQLVKVWELSLAGQAASSSSPTFMILSRDSTIGTTNTAGSNLDAAMDPATAALTAAVITGNANTTKPQRSSTLHLMNCSLNAFGGVYFWRANRLEECTSVLGNGTTNGEISLTAFTGGTPGAVGVHGIYEPL